MPWEDRLRIGQYIGPKGDTFEFQFDDLERKNIKKQSANPIPGVDGDDDQDLGNRSVQMPMTIYFSGEDYDLTADRFWSAITEKGSGVLKHPRWGDLNVLPTTVSQKESFVDRSGEAIFTVVFTVLPSLEFLRTAQDKKETALNALGESDIANATNFQETIDLSEIDDKAVTKTFFQQLTEDLNDTLRPLVSGTADLLESFDSTVKAMTDNIDDLLDDPIALAENTIRLMRFPARAQTSIQAKIDGYGAVLTTLFDPGSTLNNNLNTYSDVQVKNQYASQELAAFGAVAALTDSTLFTTYTSELQFSESITTDDFLNATPVVTTKSQVSQILENLLDTLATLIETLDGYQDAFQVQELADRYDYSETTLKFVSEAVSDTARYLIQTAFDLNVEKVVTTTSERTPLDLCYQFYGDITALDFFIETNSLQGSELIIVPVGREIIYYA